MRVLVYGGRDFTDYDFLNAELNKHLEKYYIWHPEPEPYGGWHWDLVIISGMARGADSLAVQWANLNYVDVLKFPADWKRHGRAAGPIRNQQMLDEGKPELGIGFPGGTGTKDMTTRLTKAGIPVISYTME